MSVSSKTNPANRFEIPVHDLHRARNFYEKVFGTNLDPLEIGDVLGPGPSSFSVNIDSTLAAVEQSGGTVGWFMTRLSVRCPSRSARTRVQALLEAAKS
jgi:predicted enzyme related to lactoylglutathione lyase